MGGEGGDIRDNLFLSNELIKVNLSVMPYFPVENK